MTKSGSVISVRCQRSPVRFRQFPPLSHRPRAACVSKASFISQGAPVFCLHPAGQPTEIYVRPIKNHLLLQPFMDFIEVPVQYTHLLFKLVLLLAQRIGLFHVPELDLVVFLVQLTALLIPAS